MLSRLKSMISKETPVSQNDTDIWNYSTVENTESWMQGSSPFRQKGKKNIFITRDWGLLERDRFSAVHLLVLPKNKNKKPFIHTVKFHFLVEIDTDTQEIDEDKSRYNLNMAGKDAVESYIELNSDKYDISPQATLTKSKYEIVFNNAKWNEKKVTVWCWDKHIQDMAKSLLSFYRYESIEQITLTDFEKWFWESLFISRSNKTKMNPQDLYIFTTKLWKQFETNPGSDPRNMLKDMVKQSGAWALRNTCINLLQIMKNTNAELPDAMEKDSENFDNVYVSILKTWFQAWGRKLVESFNQLAEITERTYFLKKAIKKALKTPLIGMWFMTAVAILAVYKTVPIIEDVYWSFNAPVPTLTLVLKGIVYWLIWNWYVALVLNMLFISWYDYWSNYTMYGKKFMHDLFLTSPVIWGFMKTRDYEIFTSIAAMLWPIGQDPKIILDSLKQVVTNYHLRWVINTAAIRWEQMKTSPWTVFEKFPMYIDPKIANAFKWEWSPDSELRVLARIYKSENDDFIDNLEKILEPVLMVFVVWMLWFIIFSVVIPLYGIVNVVK